MSQEKHVIDLMISSEDDSGLYSETPDSLSEDLSYEEFEGEFDESSNSSYEVKVKVYNGA